MVDSNWFIEESGSGSFEHLIVWQKAIDLAVNIYKLTKQFPESEQFALTDQLRRASTSVSANIAEGYGRGTNKDKLHFYKIAYGSLLETKSFIYLAQKLDYLKTEEQVIVLQDISVLQKQINAYVRTIKNG